MRTLLLVATTLLIAGMAIPAVQAQDVGIKNPNVATPTTLYFHLINVQDMPINTQKPSDKFSDEGKFGTTTSTITCLDGPTQGQGQGTTSQIYHTFYGYSSPSYVEYDFESNGQPRTHPERGISYDTIISQSDPFTLTWYVTTFNGGEDGPTAVLNGIPAPIPNVVVRATMKTGDAISIDDRGYDGGETIAEGATTGATLVNAGPSSQAVVTSTGQPSTEVRYVGPVSNDPFAANVWEFTVTMVPQKEVIPRSSGFNVRVDIYADMQQACAKQNEKEYIMPNMVAAHTDSENRPRMVLSVMNPIRLEYLHPQFVGDDLVVHTSMNSAWGNYDVAEVNSLTPDIGEDGIQVSIDGPSPAQSLAKAALVQRYHEHYHHQEAVDVTYVWPYKTDRASNGLYTVFVQFTNDQQTAIATGTAQFEIGKGTVIGCGGIQESSQSLSDDCAESVQVDGKTAAKESPGLPLAGLLAAVAALALVLRRRQA